MGKSGGRGCWTGTNLAVGTVVEPSGCHGTICGRAEAGTGADAAEISLGANSSDPGTASNQNGNSRPSSRSSVMVLFARG